ncbi:MAG: DUF429 domain-containing protein [Candidatus Aenigmatarchaeota archaeon]
MIVVGIDLAASEKRPTGFCILKNNKAKTFLLFLDNEIVSQTIKVKPDIIAIDAPLALPKKGKSLRECDKELLKLGIKFFPINLKSMKELTKRGIRLRKIFERNGLKVIETYPGAAQDILKIPRKKKGIEKLRKALIKIGIKGIKNKISEHELDAITSAYVGKLYLENRHTALGDPKEILMILPKV